MGFEKAEALSIPFLSQDVRQSIPAWLSTQSRYEHVYAPPIPHGYKQDVVQNIQQGFWTSNLSRSAEDVDQTSIASVDDNISVGDSAHSSYSSEASSQTSWTSATESSDTFLDDDGKEQLAHLARVNSFNSTEAQEHSLSGIRKDDDSAFGLSGPSCPIETTIRGIKGRVSSLFRLPCPEQRQQPPQADSRSWTSDASFAPNVQHCRTRRSACSSQRSYPPRLRRDTDVTEHFVALLIVFAKRLITAIWPASDCPPMSSDCFGAGVLPLETFIRETLRRSKTSFSTLQVALYYLILLKARMPQAQTASKCKGDVSEKAQCRAMQCGRRMFLSALMLASKYLQDRNYSTRAWSKISGLRSNEINENEREYLAKINYDLHLSKDTFENWSKIVMVLSKLSNEGPCSDPGLVDESFDPSGNNSNMSLAAMVSQVDFDDLQDGAQQTFTGDWWSSLLLKLEPGVAKDASLADQFLRRYIPSNRLHLIASLPPLSPDSNTPSDHPTSASSSVTHVDDLNFGDINNARNPQLSGIHGLQTPQTPVQMSPASRPSLATRPQLLGNLPTPQTTPRIPSQSTGEKSCLRMTSLEAMRNLRKQCFRNANLERCPPPQPQSQPHTVFLPSMKEFMRSAENLHELSMRSTTPLTGSPVSVSSDSTNTTSSTVRSRSSSISSVSSWSSLGSVIPQMRRSMACGLSSPLSRVCSLSERTHKPASNDVHPTEVVLDESCPLSTDKQEPISTFNEAVRVEEPRASPTSPEVAAIHGLMSLSTQSETPSQSATPTPQRLSEKGLPTRSKTCGWQDHKRKLSKTEPNLQAQVKDLIWDGSWSAHNNVVEDPILPYYGMMHRQLQMTTTLRKENRRPVANPLNSKRLCSLQHSSSTPTALSRSESFEPVF